MKVVTSEEMREIEGRAEQAGISIPTLIERAGAAVAEVVSKMAGPGSILTLVGPGNNGSDGVVASRILREAGSQVAVYSFRREPQSSTARWERMEDDVDFRRLDTVLANASIVVDALLGTGGFRAPEGALARLIDRVNGSGRSILAVDLPTGVNADTGAVPSTAVRASRTLCMGYLKRGVVLYPGAEFAGRVSVADLGFLPDAADNVLTSVPGARDISRVLPRRTAEGNKGSSGRLLFVGGSVNFAGAPVLAATGAYRAGAGLVEIAVPRDIQPIVASQVTEAIFQPLPQRDGQIDIESSEALKDAVGRAKAVVMGPGMGLSDNTITFVRKMLLLLATAGVRAVVDADALNALAQLPEWWRTAGHLILTPHPGEMARLTDSSIPRVQADRMRTARDHAQRWGVVLVLKGAGTVIAAPDGRMSINPTGGPNLATAGTGDVLSGVIGGLLAQGADPFDAAVGGAYLHGRAGDILRRDQGDVGTIAGDLLPMIPIARHATLEEGRSQE